MSNAVLSPDQDAENAELVAEIWDTLDTVKDPCHVLSGHDLSILDLGLVNRVEVTQGNGVVALTLTEVSCTFGYRIIEQIEELAAMIDGVEQLRVVIEPFPIWTPDRMSERGRLHHAARRQAFFADPASLATRPDSSISEVSA